MGNSHGKNIKKCQKYLNNRVEEKNKRIRAERLKRQMEKSKLTFSKRGRKARRYSDEKGFHFIKKAQKPKWVPIVHVTIWKDEMPKGFSMSHAVTIQ